MHVNSLRIMERMIKKYLSPGKVIDIGSQDYSGCYKPLFDGFDYIGVDIIEGKNVDVVMTGPYEIPLEDEIADIIVSGQCLEHVKNPFRLMAEACRLLKPGGYVVCIAPALDGIHRYPIDTFRFHPDGMEAIFEECNVRKVECFISKEQGNIHDCCFVGKK